MDSRNEGAELQQIVHEEQESVSIVLLPTSWVSSHPHLFILFTVRLVLSVPCIELGSWISIPPTNTF